MSKKLVDYGNACIIYLKKDNKIAAEAMLKSIVKGINQYHVASLYAIQYDIYNYMKNMAKKSNFKSKFEQNTENDITLTLKKPADIEQPDYNEMLNSVENTENYINSLIKHTKNFEKTLCSARNKYLAHNSDQLINIAKNNYYSACSSNDLQDIVKHLVKIYEN